MAFKEPKGKWFQEDLKNSRKDFKNVGNCIEAFKFKYERQNHLTEWILGISTAIFLSLSIASILNSPTEWIRVAGFWAYIVTLLTILISIFLHIWTNNRQKKAMSWLYRERDKQENGQRKNKKNRSKNNREVT